MEITKEKIIHTLKNWGWNEGDFEEIIVLLANDQQAIKDVYVDVNDDDSMITYYLELTPSGIETYINWCLEKRYSPNLQGKLRNEFIFEDDDIDSVSNTLKEWE